MSQSNLDKLSTNNSHLMSTLSSIGAGSFAGAIGILVGHPFDSLKTRMQVGKGFTSNHTG